MKTILLTGVATLALCAAAMANPGNAPQRPDRIASAGAMQTATAGSFYSSRPDQATTRLAPRGHVPAERGGGAIALFPPSWSPGSN